MDLYASNKSDDEIEIYKTLGKYLQKNLQNHFPEQYSEKLVSYFELRQDHEIQLKELLALHESESDVLDKIEDLSVGGFSPDQKDMKK